MSTSPASSPGRTHQKNRTRRHITEAAIRLRDKGLPYSLEQVAEEAEVSRATVYRYFSSVSDLNAEIALAVQIKKPEDLFDPGDPDPVQRALIVQTHLFELTAAHEAEFRAYLKASMDHWERNPAARGEPLREGRRARLLEAALLDLKPRMPAGEFETLVQALSLLTFIEPFIVLRDVFGLPESAASEVQRWAIRRILESVP